MKWIRTNRIWIVTAVVIILMCAAIWSIINDLARGIDIAVGATGEWVEESFEYELQILTDEGTGCQYIAISRGQLASGVGVSPRLDSKGKHIYQ